MDHYYCECTVCPKARPAPWLVPTFSFHPSEIDVVLLLWLSASSPKHTHTHRTVKLYHNYGKSPSLFALASFSEASLPPSLSSDDGSLHVSPANIAPMHSHHHSSTAVGTELITLCLTLANLASISCFLSCSFLILSMSSLDRRWPPSAVSYEIRLSF